MEDQGQRFGEIFSEEELARMYPTCFSYKPPPMTYYTTGGLMTTFGWLSSNNRILRYFQYCGVCHICNNYGHLPSDCKVGSGVCYRCNEAGHFAKDCKSPQLCYKCKKSGHTGHHCPENRNNRLAVGYNEEVMKRRRFDGICHICHRYGHLTKDCKLGSAVCYRCNEAGHFAKECAYPRLCYKCKNAGHTGRHCPQNRKNYDSFGKLGHIFRNCD